MAVKLEVDCEWVPTAQAWCEEWCTGDISTKETPAQTDACPSPGLPPVKPGSEPDQHRVVLNEQADWRPSKVTLSPTAPDPPSRSQCGPPLSSGGDQRSLKSGRREPRVWEGGGPA